MRKPPPSLKEVLKDSPVFEFSNKKNLVTQTRKYELITPLYGGGVEPNIADPIPITLIRGTSIRGQLRFWWRACFAGQFASIDEMKKKEDELWGTASTKQTGNPSQVQVEVEANTKGEDVRPFQVVQKIKDRKPQFYKNGKAIPQIKPEEHIAPSYAAFPLRPEKDDQLIVGMPVTPLRKNVSFTLTVTFPSDFQEAIETTLWAWETFGGIGARTRRGFGAIKLVSVNGICATLPEVKEVEILIKNNLKTYVKNTNKLENVPHLAQNLRFRIITKDRDRNLNSVNDAWAYLIKGLMYFRQQRPGPPNDPGRNKWPEPDAIRKLTKQHSSGHAPEHDVEAFPRAAFGLPIIFHFKDRDEGNPYNSEQDPRDTMLVLADSDRLASPLILRPIACKDGFVALAILLEGTQRLLDTNQVTLKTNEKKGPANKKNQIWANQAVKLNEETAPKIKDIDGNPLLDGETDVLKAFLKWL